MARDTLGNEITVGDYVGYATRHQGVKVGRVTKITYKLDWRNKPAPTLTLAVKPKYKWNVETVTIHNVGKTIRLPVEGVPEDQR